GYRKSDRIEEHRTVISILILNYSRGQHSIVKLFDAHGIAYWIRHRIDKEIVSAVFQRRGIGEGIDVFRWKEKVLLRIRREACHTRAHPILIAECGINRSAAYIAAFQICGPGLFRLVELAARRNTGL